MSRSTSAFLTIALLVAFDAAAVHNDRRFERIGSAEGLSDLEVRAIAQDRRGFIWFGTSEGLNRFDGRSMVVYRRDPRSSFGLGSNRISALLVDSTGTLWIGTRGGGLSRFDPATERFETFRHDPKDPGSLSQDDIAALVEDRGGRLWAGTSRGGLNRIDLTDPRRPRFIRYQNRTNDPRSLSDDRTRILLVDWRGRLWIGTMGGINRMDGDHFVHYRHDPARPDSVSDDEVWALAEDRDGVIWAGSWGGGLSRLDQDATDVAGGRFVNIRSDSAAPFSLSDDRVMSILEDRQGTLWIGTQDQLNELLPSEKKKDRPRFIRHATDPNSAQSLSGDHVIAAFEDRDGDLWFGMEHGGVSRIDRGHAPFERLVQEAADPLRLGPTNGVRALLEDSRGVLWIGTSKGLDRVVRGGDRFVPARVTHFTEGDDSGFDGESVTSLAEDRQGTIWIGSIGGTLFALTSDQALAEKPRFVQFKANERDPSALASDAVLSLLVDPQGQLWVGTYRGLHRAIYGDTGLPRAFVRWRHHRHDPSTLSADTIQSLTSAGDGKLWVGTYRGLNLFDPATGWAVRFVPDAARPGSISHEYINDVHVDRSGDLWAGTWGGGLCRLRKGASAFEVFGTREGFPSETIRDIAEDAGGLWVATARGLVRIAPGTMQMQTLDARDGLHHDDLNVLQWRRDGALMAGGTTGLTSFDPRALAADSSRPPVVLTGLRVLNAPVSLKKSVDFSEEVRFGPRDYLFTIEFAALGFRRPEKLRYAYRLVGFDRGWIDAGADDRKAVYSNVPPGQYAFRVRAMNADGVWSERAAPLRVTVLPPWWKTWWARVGALVLLIAIAVAWPLARLARERRISAMLDRKVTERTAELQEANRKLDLASRTDLLTALPNRRHFLEKAEEHLANFRRTGRTFAVALADVDNFKSVNDTWGHETGDLVLKSVAEALRLSLRETDVVARWGGEEFIFLLPETDAAGAMAVAEKAREAVAALREPLPVSVTVGVATIGPEMQFDQCSARADEALYEGKRTGKNRVVLARL